MPLYFGRFRDVERELRRKAEDEKRKVGSVKRGDKRRKSSLADEKSKDMQRRREMDKARRGR